MSTTSSRHRFRKYPNLVRDLELVRSEHVWVCDITYTGLRESFCCLSLITDAYSRKIVGYNLEPTSETQGCVKALAMALNTRSKAATNKATIFLRCFCLVLWRK